MDDLAPAVGEAEADDLYPWDRTFGQALFRLLKVIAPGWQVDGVVAENDLHVRITVSDPEENVYVEAVGSRDDPA